VLSFYWALSSSFSSHFLRASGLTRFEIQETCSILGLGCSRSFCQALLGHDLIDSNILLSKNYTLSSCTEQQKHSKWNETIFPVLPAIGNY
jgi:hypothetical protein